MKFGVIKEFKVPVDRRVVFSPEKLKEFQEKYPEANFAVETSDVRIFSDNQYQALGFDVVSNLSDCDVLFGVKEVPMKRLIANKTYFFFSHTIKKQEYNRNLLKTCLEKNITLIDHETLVDENSKRLIGFGRYAGIVGCYNTFRAFGLKYELFNLAKAETLTHKEDLVSRLKRQILPPVKIAVTGRGKVAQGIIEMLEAVKIKKVSIEQFLQNTFDQPVYVQLIASDYYKRIDDKPGSMEDFKQNPTDYTSDFSKFSKVTDILIAGHFAAKDAPEILSREMLNNAYNEIKVIGDITCDINGPIASTIKPSTIAEPFYGYYPKEHQEVSLDHPAAITIMAVDNLPCELPKDASEGFGEVFLEKIVPAFFNNDKDNILKNATICKDGNLTERFSYLKDFVEKN